MAQKKLIWLLIAIGFLLSLGTNLALLYFRSDAWLPENATLQLFSDKAPPQAEATPDDEDEAKGWNEWMIGLNQLEDLAAELRQKESQLADQAASIARSETRLIAEREELERARDALDERLEEIEGLFVRFRQAERANVRSLSRMYAEMNARAAADLFKELEEELAVKILNQLPQENAGNILQELASREGDDARLAARLTSRIHTLLDED